MPFQRGDSVGILYSQQNSQGQWTTGIHNGAFLSRGSRRYHVRHAGNAANACSIGTRTIYFYYNRDAYLYDYNRIRNGTLTNVRIGDIYLLSKIYAIVISNANNTKNPAIAFAVKGQYDSSGRHVVHNGRFLRFNVRNAAGQVVRVYDNYQNFRRDYPTCSSISDLNGELHYVHYNLRRMGAGRYEPFREILSANILNVRRLV